MLCAALVMARTIIEQAMQTQRTPQIKHKQEETKLGEEYAPAIGLLKSSSSRVAT